jgi:hypothetical protein
MVSLHGFNMVNKKYLYILHAIIQKYELKLRAAERAVRRWLVAFSALVVSAFFPYTPPPEAPPRTNCSPGQAFHGYTFLNPEIVNINAAYAPFFLNWRDYYQENYYTKDIQREENIAEWNGRFCTLATADMVDAVVYGANTNELVLLYNAAAAPAGKKPGLPGSMGGNLFAEVLAYNGCLEAISYLMFARSCEPYAAPTGDGWQLPERPADEMQALIREGVARFRNTRSHFIRLRYAFQVVRLAHYARQWQQTVDLYNELMPQVDRRRRSIVFYWTLGHLAGALQQLGKYPEAAYRFALVFRDCPSKRAQAFRSFHIRHDADWQAALRLCQTTNERATMLILRDGHSKSYAIDDLTEVYDLEPAHPQLDLLLVSAVQQLERIFLRTPVTDQKYGLQTSATRREKAAQHLLQLQAFVRRTLREGRVANPRLWQSIVGYLELLAGDRYAALKSFDRAEAQLDNTNEYHQALRRQLEEWRVLADILGFNPQDAYAEEAAFRVRSLAIFKENPHFEPFLQDWMSARYADSKRPGKAFVAAYDAAMLGLNPNLAVLDDLLKAIQDEDPIFMEQAMALDTNPARLQARILDLKGTYLWSLGQPESALAVFRQIPASEQARMPQFSPFREVLGERVHRPLTDTLLLTRPQILEKLNEYEFQAKAAAGLGNREAARYYYLIGLAYYNMSYFGYSWSTMDAFRSGRNWLRLAQGPVFPLNNSPAGNRENTDVTRALSYFERALIETKDPEMAARAAFMAARCRQKQWFCQADTPYRFGSKLVPVLPPDYNTYYDLLLTKYSNTNFFQIAVKECKWLAAYAR